MLCADGHDRDIDGDCWATCPQCKSDARAKRPMIVIPDRLPAITVCQPYADLIAQGGNVKPIENRKWSTSYRGPIIIHAGKSRTWMDEDDPRAAEYVFGAHVAIAQLVACLPRRADTQGVRDIEELRWPVEYRALYDHEHANGPVCWILQDVWRLPKPIAVNGQQGIWHVHEMHVRMIREQIADAEAATA